MANNSTKLTSGEIFNIDLPADKSVIENRTSDLSKNSTEFRNLDSNFLVDNGYVRFIDNEADYSNVSAFREIVTKSVRKNLFLDPNEEVEILPLTDDELEMIVENYERSELEIQNNINLLICLTTSSEYSIEVIPGSHHIVEAINKTLSIPQNQDRLIGLRKNMNDLHRFTIRMNRHEFAYILPNLLRKVAVNGEGSAWFKVVDGRKNMDTTHNFNSFDGMITEYNYRFVDSVNESTVPISWISKDRRDSMMRSFKDLQERGWGQLMEISEETLVFRVRGVSSDSIVKMGDPSLYEAMYEVVYYHDMSQRVKHSNYDIMDCFEVRTSGFIARRRNNLFTADMYSLCTGGTNEESDFTFDPIKIAIYLRDLSFNGKIKEWYPREEKKELTGLCLNNFKKYSTMVFKYRTLDQKNLTRMAMVEDWIRELDVKGGFVISDPNAENGSFESNGYLIISGEPIVYGHGGRSGDLNTFMDRYDSFHWKKVKRYNERTHDLLFDVNYDEIPDSFFVIDHSTLESDNSYQTVRNTLLNFA